MVVRRANKKDLREIATMAKAMIDYHRSLDGYYKASSDFKNLESDLEKELADKSSLFLVSEENGALLGYFRGAIEPAPAYAAPKKIGVVYDLFVKENYRKGGAGESLFLEALNWFKIKNIKNIELNVDARNAAGINFWKKMGFFEYKIRMKLNIGNP